MWRRKPGFDVCPGACSAWGGRAYLVVARLYVVAVPGACSHTAECILPVVLPAAAAATELLAGHGMIDVAALHALTTVTRRGWDAGVGACGPQLHQCRRWSVTKRRGGQECISKQELEQ